MPDAVIGGGGAVKETRDFYPFGSRLPGRSLAASSPTSEDYTGHELDDATGLHYAGARYYMSALGRWTTTDPILSGNPEELLKKDVRLLSMSPYNYAFDNPTNLTDPTGECPVCLAVWGAVEVGLAAYDAYDAYRTVTSDRATAKQKKNAIKLATIGAIGPGGGYNRLVRAADHMMSGGRAGRPFLDVSGFVKLSKSGMVDPAKIRFSQSSISPNFRGGKGSVKDLVAKLKSGEVKPGDIPAIRLVEKGGKIFSLDNRRLKAFQDAGVEIPYTKLDEIPESQMFKFTTGNEGVSITIRGQ